MAISKEDILEAVAGMTVMELNDLVKAFEEKFGVSAASLAVAAVHAANAFEHELVVINSRYAPHPVNEAALAALGFGDRVQAWREAGQELLSQGAQP